MLIAKHEHWHHMIEVAPGITTPGTSNSKGLLDLLDGLGLPPAFDGAKVLDLGCRDGFFSFELEKRGAEVTPVDYATPESTGFPIAAQILGSSLQYVVENVYCLDPIRLGTYEHVLCLGLLYHLRNPMIALDRIRSIVREGGLLWVETHLAAEPTILESSLPLWQFFPRNELNDDDSNMWGPNMTGLTKVLEECEFEVLDTVTLGYRGIVKARAVTDARLGHVRDLDSAAVRLAP
jgi:tRNA (mo5U34)-methyltransferase